jgi:hypothetical protein
MIKIVELDDHQLLFLKLLVHMLVESDVRVGGQKEYAAAIRAQGAIPNGHKWWPAARHALWLQNIRLFSLK